jgi:hypothetical protein
MQNRGEAGSRANIFFDVHCGLLFLHPERVDESRSNYDYAIGMDMRDFLPKESQLLFQPRDQDLMAS